MMNPPYLTYLDSPVQYATYDDFNKRFRVKRPESFNFAKFLMLQLKNV